MAFITGFVGFTGFALYPIIIQPMVDPDYYSESQFLISYLNQLIIKLSL